MEVRQGRLVVIQDNQAIRQDRVAALVLRQDRVVTLQDNVKGQCLSCVVANAKISSAILQIVVIAERNV
jgi:hypothetical protein